MRVKDRQIERIAEFDSKNYYGVSSLEIEETGQRMMIWGSEEVSPNGPTNTWHLVDFATGTVRRLVGMKWGSGSVPRLFPEGHLFVVGSNVGVSVIDLDAATRTFVPNSPFYAIYPIPGRPRAVVAGAEPGGGGGMEDLYVFDVP